MYKRGFQKLEEKKKDLRV
uniref:Uncharacterized protein n=1 Tax=Anguilla anguilla TaxID=7936 RepID=A0A0E9U2Z7_ANGAN